MSTGGAEAGGVRGCTPRLPPINENFEIFSDENRQQYLLIA